MTDSPPTHAEINRQFRVLRQTLDVHSFIRDRCVLWARLIQAALLLCSVVLCATTFASDDLYRWLGLEPADGRNTQGVVSVVTFAVTVLLLCVDLQGRAARENAAVERWSWVLKEFRQVQPEQGQEWPIVHRQRLHDAYWAADRESIKIPGSTFVRYKAKHLRKVEVSMLSGRYPGCPHTILGLVVLVRDIVGACRDVVLGRNGTGADDA